MVHPFVKLLFRQVVGCTEGIHCFLTGAVPGNGLMGSNRDWDTVVGRTLGELREARERLQMLQSEARRRGERLKQAGHFLAVYPEYLIQEGESVVNAGFSSQPQVHIWNDADIFPAREIRKLTSEIRKEIQTIATLTTTLRNLGH
jgi:hypothetical protein